MSRDYLNRDLSIPLTVQVQQVLSDRIKSGEYALGSRIPNELELSKEFEVSRPTIRKALDELEKKGMILRVRPKGTFVSSTMKKSWFEGSGMPGTVKPPQPLQLALEESLTDTYLFNYLESFAASSGRRVELVHWNNWYDAIENIINKFIEKKVPDVFSVSNDAVGIFARMGVILPLDDFLPPERLSRLKQRCARYGLNAYVYNGKLYAYPMFSETRLLFYRKDHFANAGIPSPLEQPLTHDSFIEISQKLSNPDKGLYAYAYPTDQDPRTLQTAMPWIIERGGCMFRIDNGRIMPATEEPEFIEALRWYTDLVLKHKICPPFPPVLSSRDIISMFQSGKISMMEAAPNVLKWMMDVAGGQDIYGLAPRPAGPVNNYAFLGGMPLCISSSCKDPDVAWKLIQFICDPEVLIPYTQHIGTFLPIELYDVDEILAHSAEYLHPAVRALETAVPHSYPVGYNQTLEHMRVGYWQTPLPQVLSLILQGELSVENGAKYLSMSVQTYTKNANY